MYNSNTHNVQCTVYVNGTAMYRMYIVELKGKDGQELCLMCSDRISASDLSKWNMFCKSRRTLFSLRRQTLSGLRRRT